MINAIMQLPNMAVFGESWLHATCHNCEQPASFMYRTSRVATCQGKVREKQNFLQVRELSGNFEKMSGNFGRLTNVREMSGNFVMTIKFFQK